MKKIERSYSFEYGNCVFKDQSIPKFFTVLTFFVHTNVQVSNVNSFCNLNGSALLSDIAGQGWTLSKANFRGLQFF